MAKGIRDGVVWTLDSVDLFTGQSPLEDQDEEFRIIKTPHQNKFVVRSAEELRERLPKNCLLYTSPSPRDRQKSRMPSSA